MRAQIFLNSIIIHVKRMGSERQLKQLGDIDNYFDWIINFLCLMLNDDFFDRFECDFVYICMHLSQQLLQGMTFILFTRKMDEIE